MSEIEWGEYELQELFDITGTKSLDSNAINFTNTGVNFVGRTFENNGIQGKIQRRHFEPNEPCTITATVIGNYKYVKYQTEEYYCSQNINKLSPKAIFKKWNKSIAYFIVTNIQKFVSLYDGQQGGYKLEDIKQHKIKLPIKNNEIDFDFMESFIAELEVQRIAELEAYLSVTGLKDTHLSFEEEQALINYDDIRFKDYKLTDIFDVKNTGNILSRDIVENSGKTPYLCASAENNSVSSYISYNDELKTKGNCIFIGGKTFAVSYQENDFFSNDSHNLSLYLKNADYQTKYTQMYLATCVYKSLKHKYSWGDSISNKKAQKDYVTLPTKNGKVDYACMNTLISAIHKLVIKDVVQYSDDKISAAKKVVSKKI